MEDSSMYADLYEREMNKIHKTIQNCHKCQGLLCRSPILGAKYHKHRIIIIGQNPLLGEYKSDGSTYGYLKQDYKSYRKNWIAKFNSDTPIKVLRFLIDCVPEMKSKDPKTLFDYCMYSNAIKHPSGSGTYTKQLIQWFNKCKIDGKSTIQYEVDTFKPRIILVIGRDTFKILNSCLNLTRKTDILYYYGDIPVIAFYHVARGWWFKKCNKLNEKKVLLKELLR